MSFKRSTAVTLATITMTLGAGGPALAMPIHDAPTVSQVVPSPRERSPPVRPQVSAGPGSRLLGRHCIASDGGGR
jgi:hypothetical protein